MERRLLRIAIAMMVLMLGGATVSEAVEMDPKVALVPGGQTIGGPGALTLAVSDFAVLFRSGGGAGGPTKVANVPTDVCLTIHTFTNLVVNLTYTQPAGDFDITVDPNETKVHCMIDVIGITAECQADTRFRADPNNLACEMVWRVDRYTGPNSR